LNRNGMITEEKFYEKASKFALFKNTDDKYFDFEEYSKIIKENQTDRNHTLIYLYSTNKTDQFSYIEKAKAKGYDVLLMDGQLDPHLINHMESKNKDSRFVRVDSDVIEKIIQKEEQIEAKLKKENQDNLRPVFDSLIRAKNKDHFTVIFESLNENDAPVIITQSEFMRRMKDMSQLGGGMSFYGDMPDSYNLVVNANNPLIIKLSEELETGLGDKLKENNSAKVKLREEVDFMEKEQKKRKAEEINQVEKDDLESLRKKLIEVEKSRNEIISSYSADNKLVKQLIDLALLANNMLRGEELNTFVKRSIELL
jgi:molecular chaperone HtpG